MGLEWGGGGRTKTRPASTVEEGLWREKKGLPELGKGGEKKKLCSVKGTVFQGDGRLKGEVTSQKVETVRTIKRATEGRKHLPPA